MDVFVNNIFLEISIKVRCACTSKINQINETIRRLLINTVPAYMPIDEIPIVPLFLFSV